jgi:hypothetical protein
MQQEIRDLLFTNENLRAKNNKVMQQLEALTRTVRTKENEYKISEQDLISNDDIKSKSIKDYISGKT